MTIKKIGILGGSFDPVHKGHITIAKIAIKMLNLDKVILIPCARHSQKSDFFTSVTHRLNMLHMAVENETNIQVDEIEINLIGISYTINTLKYLYNKEKNKYFLIIGIDQLINFCSWFQWEDILCYAELIVFQRADMIIKIPNKLNSRMLKINRYIRLIPSSSALYNISSTSIREKIYNNLLLNSKELSLSVINYIYKFNLYNKILIK